MARNAPHAPEVPDQAARRAAHARGKLPKGCSCASAGRRQYVRDYLETLAMLLRERRQKVRQFVEEPAQRSNPVLAAARVVDRIEAFVWPRRSPR